MAATQNTSPKKSGGACLPTKQRRTLRRCLCATKTTGSHNSIGLVAARRLFLNTHRTQITTQSAWAGITRAQAGLFDIQQGMDAFFLHNDAQLYSERLGNSEAKNPRSFFSPFSSSFSLQVMELHSLPSRYLRLNSHVQGSAMAMYYVLHPRPGLGSGSSRSC